MAGTGTAGYTGDGGLAVLAELNVPSGLCFDGSGNLFIGDTYNSVVRRIDTLGIITTIAGSGIAGNSGDGGPATAAEVNVADIVVDRAGNIYINSGSYCIYSQRWIFSVLSVLMQAY